MFLGALLNLNRKFGSITNVSILLFQRSAPAAAELHDVLYAAGGFDGKEYLQ